MAKPLSVVALVLCGVLASATVIADQIPLDDFAAPEAISDAAITSDGHYLAEVEFSHERRIVVVHDLTDLKQKPVIVASDVPGKFDISWCSWATKSRLLCSYYGITEEGYVQFSVTRLVAVDANGSNMRVLVQNSDSAGGQYEDRVIDWNPGIPDTVLIEADESLLDSMSKMLLEAGGDVYGQTTSGGYPAIFELNVVTGKLHLRLHSRPPIWSYLTDTRGNPRIGFGVQENTKTYEYFTREASDSGWHHLLKFEAFAQGNLRAPIAIDPANTSHAFAMGNLDGRDALWSIDLTDVDDPKVVYSNPQVDVDGVQFLKNRELIGVSYVTDRPHFYYANSKLTPALKLLDAALSETTNRIVDCTDDDATCVVVSSSDVEPGTWYLLHTAPARLTPLGRTNPQLDSSQLAHVAPISYPARDGTIIPGYLTVPPGAKPEHLPLIVMPHGGPIARDEGSYFFLQQFLVNRGYAVLQMNFRGSGGYGHKWYAAAHQDWGGVTYDDIVDGTRWAISSGLADPKRVAIVGWSFGGYAALLGAVRDADLFRCAVSVAGISDLSDFLGQMQDFMGSEISMEQIGTRSEKLKADSPRRHVDAATIPVLMFHGDKDINVKIDQSRTMAKALKSAGKPYQLIEFQGADHQIRPFKDRKLMLETIEGFLSAHMGAQN